MLTAMNRHNPTNKTNSHSEDWKWTLVSRFH